MADPSNSSPPKRPAREVAERALKEAAERRATADAPERPRETGRKGLDPARYGDWENKGIASDF